WAIRSTPAYIALLCCQQRSEYPFRNLLLSSPGAQAGISLCRGGPEQVSGAPGMGQFQSVSDEYMSGARCELQEWLSSVWGSLVSYTKYGGWHHNSTPLSRSGNAQTGMPSKSRLPSTRNG